ncbi:MAG: hypothetical protein H6835_03285 [Planctomycetes bacterium]|nr:hypothetical protein [Planctomycetota bacterium]
MPCTDRARGLFVLALSLTVDLAAAQAQKPPAADAKVQASTLHGPLHEALVATARAGATSFTAEWLWHGTSAYAIADGEPDWRVTEKQTGFYADDQLVVKRIDEELQWEFWQSGRLAATRVAGKPWQLAQRGVAPNPGDGSVADPLLLLLALASQDLPVAQRTIAERDGRPVERFSLLLTVEQEQALAQTGALRNSFPSYRTAALLLKSGRMKRGDLLLGYADLCIDLDVATRHVRRIHLRVLAPEVDPMQAFLQSRRGVRRDADDGEPEPAPEPTPPTEFVDGLPVRDPAGLMRTWFEVRFDEAGKATLPQPDAELRALGR